MRSAINIGPDVRPQAAAKKKLARTSVKRQNGKKSLVDTFRNMANLMAFSVAFSCCTFFFSFMSHRHSLANKQKNAVCPKAVNNCLHAPVAVVVDRHGRCQQDCSIHSRKQARGLQGKLRCNVDSHRNFHKAASAENQEVAIPMVVVAHRTWADAADHGIRNQGSASHMTTTLPMVHPVAMKGDCCHAHPTRANYRRPHRSCRQMRNSPSLVGVAAVGGLHASASFSCCKTHRWVLHRHQPDRLHCHLPYQAFFGASAAPDAHAPHGRTCTVSHCSSPLGNDGRCRPRTVTNCEASRQLMWLCPPKFGATPSQALHQTYAHRAHCCFEPAHHGLWPLDP
mmetsp:Transcript_113501/g.219950  ORF Transcript_113501/g.219950 Transcript_113501/m.219950 type:complete len:339 (+) Transcript_113501:210-1226(+)